jgi:hypothetical protein
MQNICNEPMRAVEQCFEEGKDCTLGTMCWGEGAIGRGIFYASPTKPADYQCVCSVSGVYKHPVLRFPSIRDRSMSRIPKYT